MEGAPGGDIQVVRRELEKEWTRVRREQNSCLKTPSENDNFPSISLPLLFILFSFTASPPFFSSSCIPYVPPE